MNTHHQRCARAIIQILRVKVRDAQERHTKAATERAGVTASANAWDQMHPDDGVGGMGTNPYNCGQADKRALDARNYLATMQEVMDYAVDTFIGEEE